MVASFHGSMKLIKGNGRSLGSQRVLFGPDTGQIGLSNIRWQERFASGADGWRDLELDSPTAPGDPADVLTVIASPEGAEAVAGALRDIGVVTATDFGVKADGVTDDATALLAMRDYINGLDGDSVKILMPAGGYIKTSNSKMLYGLTKRVMIDWQGCKYQRISAGGALYHEFQPFNMRRLYMSTDGLSVYDTRYLINTVAAGSLIIQCSTIAHAANFASGDKIFIGGRMMVQTYYPPDLVFFESAEVASVNTGTGAITLTKRLRFNYRADWPSRPFSGIEQTGPAHIIKDHRTPYLEMRDLEILITDGEPQGRYFYPNATELYLYNVRGAGLDIAPSMSDRCLIERCNFKHYEPDKLIDYCAFIDCEATDEVVSLAQASATRSLHVIRGQYPGGMQASPIEQFVIDGAEIGSTSAHGYGAVGPYTQNSGIRTVVRNCMIRKYGALYHILNTGPDWSFTARGGTLTTLILNDDDTDFDAITCLKENFFVWKADFSKYGRITQIHVSGANIVLTGTFNAAPANGEVWKFVQIQDYVVEGNTVEAGVPNVRYPRPRLSKQELTTLRWTTDDIDWSQSLEALQCLGYIKRIMVDVDVAYSGADSTPKLNFWLVDGFDDLFTIDLATTGRRVITTGGATGSVGADSLAALPATAHRALNFYPQHGAGVPGLALPAPRVLIEVECMVAL